MLQVLKQEFEAKEELVVSITPDDISEITEDKEDMLELIRIWNKGLRDLIATKAIEQLGEIIKPIRNISGSITSFLLKFLDSKGIDLYDEKENVIFKFLEEKNITVLIDDLDRGWEGKKSDIRRVSAMLNAVRDLSRENENVFFKVSLRSDAYYLYRTSDESTDKVEGSVIWLNWTNHQLLALLSKRIITFFSGYASEGELIGMNQKDFVPILSCVFEETFEGVGKWEKIPINRLLASVIRKRPRDLVKLCSFAAKEARKNRSNRIGTKEFNAVFEDYSLGRLQDTYIEYRSELPDIEKLLSNMRPTTAERNAGGAFLFTNDKLFKKVENIMQNHTFRFSNGAIADKKDLCAFMYKINFLTARKDVDNKIIRRYFEEHRYLMSHFVDFGFNWEIHPSFRWALQPGNVADIISSLPDYAKDE
jgi:hypothetical protein